MRGRVCVITGASSGIGEATSRSLAALGASVVVAARREERLTEIVSDLEHQGATARAVRCDVTKKRDLQALLRQVETEFGRCDVLVNNAGIPGGGWFERVSMRQIDAVTTTNYLSVLWATKFFLPLLLESKGHVVNVASLAGRYALPGAAVYAATKHAVVALSESLYYELKPKGVMVTVVNPGLVTTEGFPHDRLRSDQRFGAFVMQPDRVADAIVDVIRRRRGPEVSVPRWQGGLQAFRVLTPPLYRAVLSRLVGDRATEARAEKD
ncbi:MAG: SDR family NAD(P)-dependent oxidoreductase [Actinomycetota bacterium]